MRRWILIILALAAAGCGQKPDEVVDDGSKSADSWKKTLEMVCGQWADYRVPSLYVKQMFKAGEEVLGKKLQDLEKLGDAMYALLSCLADVRYAAKIRSAKDVIVDILKSVLEARRFIESHLKQNRLCK